MSNRRHIKENTFFIVKLTLTFLDRISHSIWISEIWHLIILQTTYVYWIPIKHRLFWVFLKKKKNQILETSIHYLLLSTISNIKRVFESKQKTKYKHFMFSKIVKDLCMSFSQISTSYYIRSMIIHIRSDVLIEGYDQVSNS